MSTIALKFPVESAIALPAEVPLSKSRATDSPFENPVPVTVRGDPSTARDGSAWIDRTGRTVLSRHRPRWIEDIRSTMDVDRWNVDQGSTNRRF